MTISFRLELILSSGENCRQIFGHVYSPRSSGFNTHSEQTDRAAFLSSSSDGGIVRLFQFLLFYFL
jgi:hypothetical protein